MITGVGWNVQGVFHIEYFCAELLERIAEKATALGAEKSAFPL